MLVGQAKICLHECVSIFLQIKTNIFKHLKSCDKCEKTCNDSCFTILDSASTYHQLQIKEALHILLEKPILNKQVQHSYVSLKL